jgi:hypothetical protein
MLLKGLALPWLGSEDRIILIVEWILELEEFPRLFDT